MAKKGKPFEIPSPLFGKEFYNRLASVAVNEYRKITFDKSNPKMANNKPFPKYSKGYERAKSKGEIRVAEQIKKIQGGFERSKAPVATGALWRNTDAVASPKENAIYIGWKGESYKLDYLRNIKSANAPEGRILTSKKYPINPDVIKKMMPSFNKELKRIMPKGSQTITIGKK